MEKCLRLCENTVISDSNCDIFITPVNRPTLKQCSGQKLSQIPLKFFEDGLFELSFSEMAISNQQFHNHGS